MSNVSPRIAFIGVATVKQDGRRFDAYATVFAEGESPAASFFGHYSSAAPEGLRDGAALIRFSDGSEAEAALAVVDHDSGGFRIDGYLRPTSD